MADPPVSVNLRLSSTERGLMHTLIIGQEVTGIPAYR